MKKMKHINYSNRTDLVFIVGVGRSGTTLLMTMLNAHPDIVFPPEFMFLKHYICNLPLHKKMFKNVISALREKLSKDSEIKRLGVNIEKILQRNIEKYGHFTMDDLFLDILNSYIKKNGEKAKLVGTKYPRNIELLPEIKYLFPNAYIIHIIRDPRDTISSRLKCEWSKNKPFLYHCGVYNEILKLGSFEGNKLFENRYHEIRYEDLLDNPELEMKKICKTLNIEYYSEMLDFQNSAKEIVQKDELSFKYNNLKPLIKTNKDKWKNTLDNSKVNFIENICSDIMKKYNYKRVSRNNLIFYPFRIFYSLLRYFFLIYKKRRFSLLKKSKFFKRKSDEDL